MQNQQAQLAPKLRELHDEPAGEETVQKLRHDSILVVEPDEQVQRAVGRLLTNFFPGYSIIGVSPEQAVDKLRGDLRTRIAMVLVDTTGQVDLLSIVELLRREDYAGEAPSHTGEVPLVLMSAGNADEQGDSRFEETIREWADQGKIDGLIDKPFLPGDFAATIYQAINSRLVGASIGEQAARTRVIESFIADSKERMNLWIRDLRGLSIDPAEGSPEAPEEGSPEADLLVVIESLERMIELLSAIAEFRIDELNKKTLGRYMHDIASPLTVAISYARFVDESPSLSGSDRSTLHIFMAELDKFYKDFDRIRSARKAMVSWQSLEAEDLDSGIKDQKLEFPRGVKIKACVVDDQKLVIDVVSRDLKRAGVETVTASSLADIQAIEDEDVNLVLLDNDLGDGLKGHSLIGAIRARWPQALIVAHTGDATDLNDDPNNGYKMQGVEIVGKREWAALSGIVRRKLQRKEA